MKSALHLRRLCILSIALSSQLLSKLLILASQSLHLLANFVIIAWADENSNATLPLLTSTSIQTILLCLVTILSSRISVNASQMFIEVFLTRKAFSSVAFAIWVGAVQLLSWTTVLVVDLPLVAKETTGVCEARKLLASFGLALIWPIVLVHVLATKVINLWS